MTVSELQANGLNSTCRTISVCELLQIVNSHGLTFLTALVLRPFRASGQNYNCPDKIKRQNFVLSVASALKISKPSNSVNV